MCHQRSSIEILFWVIKVHNFCFLMHLYSVVVLLHCFYWIRYTLQKTTTKTRWTHSYRLLNLNSKTVIWLQPEIYLLNHFICFQYGEKLSTGLWSLSHKQSKYTFIDILHVIVSNFLMIEIIVYTKVNVFFTDHKSYIEREAVDFSGIFELRKRIYEMTSIN